MYMYFFLSYIFLPVTPLFSLCPHVSHITNGRLRMHAVPNTMFTHYMVTLKLPQVHVLPYTLSETLLPFVTCENMIFSITVDFNYSFYVCLNLIVAVGNVFQVPYLCGNVCG